MTPHAMGPCPPHIHILPPGVGCGGGCVGRGLSLHRSTLPPATDQPHTSCLPCMHACTPLHTRDAPVWAPVCAFRCVHACVTCMVGVASPYRFPCPEAQARRSMMGRTSSHTRSYAWQICTHGHTCQYTRATHPCALAAADCACTVQYRTDICYVCAHVYPRRCSCWCVAL